MAKTKNKKRAPEHCGDENQVTTETHRPRQTIDLHSLLRSITAQPDIKISRAEITVTSLLYRLRTGILGLPAARLIDSQRRRLRLVLSLELNPGQRINCRFREADKNDPEILYTAEHGIIVDALPASVLEKKPRSRRRKAA